MNFRGAQLDPSTSLPTHKDKLRTGRLSLPWLTSSSHNFPELGWVTWFCLTSEVGKRGFLGNQKDLSPSQWFRESLSPCYLWEIRQQETITWGMSLLARWHHGHQQNSVRMEVILWPPLLHFRSFFSFIVIHQVRQVAFHEVIVISKVLFPLKE